jgi:two-component system sensor histidine kinase AlgZ
VELARRYLAIEQLRYGQRMQVQWDIDPRAGHALLPPLVLQPLVENAVRHGVEPSSQTAMLWVQASARRGQAVLEVRNTLGEQQSDAGHGMAQANVAERLRLLHDLGGQFEAWREAGLYRARITVPLP